MPAFAYLAILSLSLVGKADWPRSQKGRGLDAPSLTRIFAYQTRRDS